MYMYRVNFVISYGAASGLEKVLCVCIYIYIYREREREKRREIKKREG